MDDTGGTVGDAVIVTTGTVMGETGGIVGDAVIVATGTVDGDTVLGITSATGAVPTLLGDMVDICFATEGGNVDTVGDIVSGGDTGAGGGGCGCGLPPPPC